MSPPDGYLKRYTALGKRGKLNFIRHPNGRGITITRSTTIGNQYYSLEQNYPVADTKALAVFGALSRYQCPLLPHLTYSTKSSVLLSSGHERYRATTTN